MFYVNQRVQRGCTVGPVMPLPLTAGDAAAEGAPLGHTGAALGGETGGSYENRYYFRRPLVIDLFFWRDF
ncbi:hypothetical protein WMF20_24515 [Sorangium sp. So ce834]|uniref:hypothetical protein n=1 Tax=Sorangium sp. So ce834 TaxID=3133321 RepID=UPI003F644633